MGTGLLRGRAASGAAAAHIVQLDVLPTAAIFSSTAETFTRLAAHQMRESIGVGIGDWRMLDYHCPEVMCAGGQWT